MRVLFQSRITLISVPGGDTIQMIKTAEALRRKGCQVDVTTELTPDLSNYDIVHLFNLMRPQETYIQALNARRQGKTVALSTIYGPYVEYDSRARGGIAGVLLKVIKHSQFEYLKVMARAIKNREIHKGTLRLLWLGFNTLQSRLIKMADVFLPNSESEMKKLLTDLPLTNGKKYLVVPNAVDIEVFDANVTEVSSEVRKYEGCILCVGRIEGRKNQLNLVRAMKDLPWPLVLIGKISPNHLSYLKQIKKEAGPNVHIIGHVEHDQLPQFYKVAKVHALISWMETPGLSSLEAGAMGCNLVITDKGTTRDYFEDYVFYCKPDSVESIRNAIIKAYESPANPALRKCILENYTWERAAARTLEGYELVLPYS